MSKLFSLLGILFLVYGAILSVYANFTFGTVLVFLLGAMFAAYGVFYEKIRAATKNGVWKWVKYAVVFCVAAELALVGFLAVYGERDNVSYNEDAVIVLGTGIHGDKVSRTLKHRLDKAIEYSEKNPEAVIVVTGGQGFQETVTEAYAMEKYLVEKGVDKAKIIKEEKSTSTSENMRFSKKILDRKFGSDYKIAVITNGFHIYRGVSIAENEGFENVTHFHAGIRWDSVLPCYLRESLAVLKMWVIG